MDVYGPRCFFRQGAARFPSAGPASNSWGELPRLSRNVRRLTLLHHRASVSIGRADFGKNKRPRLLTGIAAGSVRRRVGRSKPADRGGVFMRLDRRVFFCAGDAGTFLVTNYCVVVVKPAGRLRIVGATLWRGGRAGAGGSAVAVQSLFQRAVASTYRRIDRLTPAGNDSLAGRRVFLFGAVVDNGAVATGSSVGTKNDKTVIWRRPDPVNFVFRFALIRQTSKGVGRSGRLRPRAAFAGSQVPDRAIFAAMHHEAHDECFIANSVKNRSDL